MKNKTITTYFFLPFVLLYFLLQMNLCSKRQAVKAEILIKSYSTWAIEKRVIIGEEKEIEKENGIKKNEKIQSKKAKAEVIISRYEEAPQFFDQYGNPKTYKVKVDGEYRILCEKRESSENIDFSGRFSVHEVFLAPNPRDYSLSVSKSKLTIERKIIHKVISEIQKRCFK